MGELPINNDFKFDECENKDAMSLYPGATGMENGTAVAPARMAIEKRNVVKIFMIWLFELMGVKLGGVHRDQLAVKKGGEEAGM